MGPRNHGWMGGFMDDTRNYSKRKVHTAAIGDQ